MKSRNLNFLEPSGPLQVCNGTALAFLLIITNKWQFKDKQKLKEQFHTEVVFKKATYFFLSLLSFIILGPWSKNP